MILSVGRLSPCIHLLTELLNESWAGMLIKESDMLLEILAFSLSAGLSGQVALSLWSRSNIRPAVHFRTPGCVSELWRILSGGRCVCFKDVQTRH